ncbi:MAG: hypothetical protein JNK35_11255, partial [Phycisphaerae bacterium]|nr:hypothetical protein [Phycisphaerae bacterium]
MSAWGVVRAALAAWAWLVLAGGAAAQQPRQNILFYGNSYTNYYALPQVVSYLANVAGNGSHPVYCHNAAVGGRSLEWHLANNTAVITQTLPAGQTWDVVVLQDFSTMPTHLGSPGDSRRSAVALAQTVRYHSPNCRVVLYETWARAPGYYFYSVLPGQRVADFPGGPDQMQAELRDTYVRMCADVNHFLGEGSCRMARVGDAWQNFGWVGLHDTDLAHPSSRGTFLAGCVIYSQVFQEPVGPLSWGPLAFSMGVPVGIAQSLVGTADLVYWAGALPTPADWTPIGPPQPTPPPPPPPP